MNKEVLGEYIKEMNEESRKIGEERGICEQRIL